MCLINNAPSPSSFLLAWIEMKTNKLMQNTKGIEQKDSCLKKLIKITFKLVKIDAEN